MGNNSAILELSQQIFSNVAGTTTIFVLPLFLLRVALANLSGQGGETLAAIKAVFFYFILISGFPLILDLLFAIPESFLPVQNTQLFAAADPLESDSFSAFVPDVIGRVFEVLLAGLYWIIYFLHFLF